MLSASNALVCVIQVVLPWFLSCKKFLLPVNFISKAIGNKNKKKINDSKILGTIRLSPHVSFIQSHSIFVAKKLENNPAKPMNPATNSGHCHLVTRLTTKKPTVMVKTVFVGFDFIFMICYLTSYPPLLCNLS